MTARLPRSRVRKREKTGENREKARVGAKPAPPLPTPAETIVVRGYRYEVVWSGTRERDGLCDPLTETGGGSSLHPDNLSAAWGLTGNGVGGVRVSKGRGKRGVD
jgi:hypothetical protein